MFSCRCCFTCPLNSQRCPSSTYYDIRTEMHFLRHIPFQKNKNGVDTSILCFTHVPCEAKMVQDACIVAQLDRMRARLRGHRLWLLGSESDMGCDCCKQFAMRNSGEFKITLCVWLVCISYEKGKLVNLSLHNFWLKS